MLFLASVVSIGGGGWAISSISDGTNTWIAIGRATVAAHVAVELWMCVNNGASTALTVTPSWNSGTNAIRGLVYVGEVTGQQTSAQPDNFKAGSASSGTALATASWTPGAANELVISVGGTEGAASVTFTAGTNFTIDQQGNEGVANTALAVQSWVQGTATATTAPMTSSTSSNWATVGASIKVASVTNNVTKKARIEF